MTTSIRILLFFITLVYFSVSGLSQGIIINELMSSNQGTILDEDGDTPDWIELYNPGNETVYLEGWGLSDEPANPLKWTFPAFELQPGAYKVVYASGKDRSGEGHWETLVDRGNYWRYHVPFNELPENWRLPGFDDAEWPMGPSGFGYGDDDDNTIIGPTMSVYIRKTFNTEDMPEILGAAFHMDYDDGFVAWLNGHEIARANMNTAGEIPAFNAPADNFTEPLICFGGYPVEYRIDPALISDGVNVLAVEVHNYDISSSDLTLIPFFSVLLAQAPENPQGTPDILRLNDPNPHTDFKISSTGETICLSYPDGEITDSIKTGNLPVDVSIGRKPDGSPAWKYFNEATPGGPNNTQDWPGITSLVDFSHRAGFYDNGFQLILSTGDPLDDIYYTTDGSEPGESSQLYTSPLIIYETEVVRAKAIHPGFLPSRSTAATYFIDEPHDLPVFSISTDPDNFFDPVIGIYHDNNVWEDWERPIHIEFFDTDDTSGFSIDAGVKIYGGWTRTLPQKSLAIYARESYGYGSIDYKLFPDLPFDKWESFVLRNSGNDWNNTMFRDGMMTALVANDGVDIQAFRPSVVYINGEYWGIHNIREKFNEHFVEMHYGIHPDSLDMLENLSSPVCGSSQDYDEMIAYIESHPLSIPENYETVKNWMDIPNFITYEVAQIYFANTDWPGNNIKYYKPRKPGSKWKWMLYDTDFGFGLATDYAHNTLAFATDPAGPDWPNPPWSTFLLRKLLENPSFKIDFINRYADMINSSFRQSAVTSQIDIKRSAIISEMPEHCSRWGGTIWGWLGNVQVLQTFGSQRKSHAQSHVIQYFDLTDDSQVTLDVYPASSGKIHISTLTINEFPWAGEYFNGIPVRITAEANPGYIFKGWQGDIVSDSIAITVTFTGSIDIKAVFEAYTPDYLVINEINYNSATEFDPKDWIEIYNPYDYPVDLEGWVLKDEDDAHAFDLSIAGSLGSKGFLVLCEDTSAFRSFFPEVMNYTGNTGFGFNGSGEMVRLYDFSGLLIDTVRYDDAPPWPQEPDGNGPTLELLSPELDNALGENWTAYGQHGTPGNPNGIYINIADLSQDEPGVEIIPNPFNNETKILLVSGMEQQVSLAIYNVNGLKVYSMANLQLSKGTHEFLWNGRDLTNRIVPPGVYLCIIQGESRIIRKKIIKAL